MVSAKRARTTEPQSRKKPLGRCLVADLPIELIAEVLSHTTSPRDVLALARTNRHFHAVLVNNRASDFIWRRVRAQSLPGPIPDPPSGLSEAAFAALLFDSKICEVRAP